MLVSFSMRKVLKTLFAHYDNICNEQLCHFFLSSRVKHYSRLLGDVGSLQPTTCHLDDSS
jgi:hypothetical protein